MGQRASAFAMIAALALTACSRHESATAPGPVDPESSDPALRADALRTEAADAARFHRNLAALDWITGMQIAARAPVPAPALEGYGTGAQSEPQAVGESGVMSALLKSAASAHPRRLGPASHGRAALGKTAAAAPQDDPRNDFYFEGDTAWFDYADSSRGRVTWIHVFRDPDGTINALVLDSLVYRWPCLDSLPVLLSSSTSMRPYAGGEYHLDLNDEDGDGVLNGSPGGSPMRIRKEWRSVSADTVRKSVWHLDHGNQEERASLDEGIPVSFSDTTLVGGRAVAWTTAGDGDGDGFVLRAPEGRDLIVKTETFALDAAGNRIYARMACGAGVDGDWTAAADNPWYGYARTSLSPKGDTLAATESGDADGDGFFYDPSLGATNMAWTRDRYAGRKGYLTFRDSVVAYLGDLSAAGDDRVAFAQAWIRWPDGDESRVRSARKGGDGDFGPGDTVVVRESRVFGARRGAPAEAGTEDSLARESWMVPGDLLDPEDDQIIWSSTRTWYAAGGSLLESAEELRGPVLEYTARLTGDRRAEGRHDGLTGAFRDRISYREGEAADEYAGTFAARDGSAHFGMVRIAGGGGDSQNVSVVREGAGYRIAVAAGMDTSRYLQSGDSTRWMRPSSGGPAFFTTAATGDGSYPMTYARLDRDGLVSAAGGFLFRADGGATGWLREGDAAAGNPQVRVSISWNGSVSVESALSVNKNPR